MKDGIIKGTGNSRYLKTVADFLDRYPTYEAFAAAFVAGTLPVDLNGRNPEGWTQEGTENNKANLLADATAAKFGLSAATGTVNDALAKVPTAEMIYRMTNAAAGLSVSGLADGDLLPLYDISAGTGKKTTLNSLAGYVHGLLIATGSYVGTGTYGREHPNSLTFPFVPSIVILQDEGNADYESGSVSDPGGAAIFIYGVKTAALTNEPSSTSDALVASWSGATLSWYRSYHSSSAYEQFNASGRTYRWAAFSKGE